MEDSSCLPQRQKTWRFDRLQWSVCCGVLPWGLFCCAVAQCVRWQLPAATSQCPPASPLLHPTQTLAESVFHRMSKQPPGATFPKRKVVSNQMCHMISTFLMRVRAIKLNTWDSSIQISETIFFSRGKWFSAVLVDSRGNLEFCDVQHVSKEN